MSKDANNFFLAFLIFFFQATHLMAMINEDDSNRAMTSLRSHTVIMNGSIAAAGEGSEVRITGNRIHLGSSSRVQAPHVILQGEEIVSEGNITADLLTIRGVSRCENSSFLLVRDKE